MGPFIRAAGGRGQCVLSGEISLSGNNEPIAYCSIQKSDEVIKVTAAQFASHTNRLGAKQPVLLSAPATE